MEDEQGFDPTLNYSREDNEFWDGTDNAHPAWYRGNDEATKACSKIILTALDISIPEDAGVARLWHMAITGIRKAVKEKNKLLDAALSYESLICLFDTDILPEDAWEELSGAEAEMDEYRSIGKE